MLGYCRQEGFEPTAAAVRQRLIDLGMRDPKHDPELAREAQQELDNLRKDLRGWSVSVAFEFWYQTHAMQTATNTRRWHVMCILVPMCCCFVHGLS